MSCSILQWFCCTTPSLVSPFTMISSLFGPSRERASILTPPRVETLNLLVREYRRKLVSIYGVLHRSARWKNKLPLKLGLWSLQNIFQRSWSWRWWCSTQCGERATICNCSWCVNKKKKKKNCPQHKSHEVVCSKAHPTWVVHARDGQFALSPQCRTHQRWRQPGVTLPRYLKRGLLFRGNHGLARATLPWPQRSGFAPVRSACLLLLLRLEFLLHQDTGFGAARLRADLGPGPQREQQSNLGEEGPRRAYSHPAG